MSIDTKSIRERFASGRWTEKDSTGLCDEVDRLRAREVELISDGIQQENTIAALRAEVEALKHEIEAWLRSFRAVIEHATGIDRDPAEWESVAHIWSAIDQFQVVQAHEYCRHHGEAAERADLDATNATASQEGEPK